MPWPEEYVVQVFLTLSFDQGAVAAEARAAEDRGYDGVAAGEHLFFHGPHPNGFVALAAAAGATSRIRLLTSITVLPLYPAALTANLATTLDQVSGGRFDMGLGVEYPPEFVAAGVDVTERGAAPTRPWN
jgi:alkanesulfonate monooxygenase SsuD/methylene tetrahydromethanopterin reductase-like flavin-dependent oxidoreductase (luciferase family)